MAIPGLIIFFIFNSIKKSFPSEPGVITFTNNLAKINSLCIRLLFLQTY